METSERPRATEPETIAGDRPPRYGRRVPPPVGQEHLLLTRLRSGDRKLQRVARGTGHRATGQDEKKARGIGPRAAVIERSRGTGPRATVAGTARFIVGRGPVPRHATIARDRPSRYGPGRKKCAGDRPPRYGDREIAGDRPPRYGDIAFTPAA